MKKNLIVAASATLALSVGLLGASAAFADPTPSPTPGGYSPTRIPGYSCVDAWDFQRCIGSGGKEMGQPPAYLTHSASPGLTGGGR